MRNFVNDGDTVTYTAPSGGVTSGMPVKIGTMIVVPTANADEGARFAGKVKGVFDVTKPGSQAWTEGAIVYWDNAAAKFTTTAASNFRCGTAVDAVGAGAGLTTGRVRLDGISVIVTA